MLAPSLPIGLWCKDELLLIKDFWGLDKMLMFDAEEDVEPFLLIMNEAPFCSVLLPYPPRVSTFCGLAPHGKKFRLLLLVLLVVVKVSDE